MAKRTSNAPRLVGAAHVAFDGEDGKTFVAPLARLRLESRREDAKRRARAETLVDGNRVTRATHDAVLALLSNPPPRDPGPRGPGSREDRGPDAGVRREGFERLRDALENRGDAEGTEAQLDAAAGFLDLAFDMLTPLQQGAFLASGDVVDFIRDNADADGGD